MSLDNIEIDERWLKEIAEFPLVEALFDRRSRRFFRGKFRTDRSPINSSTSRCRSTISRSCSFCLRSGASQDGTIPSPGAFLAFPVGDLAQHTIANLCFYVQNGLSIYDDVNTRKSRDLSNSPISSTWKIRCR
ncbi:hypothetical protein QJ48_05245 [Paenibacillus sp. A3]|uniref:hypothetical protein n=1 Tax=Paenibacillus sp. A3 TaxID=1337054 RepID=UPI0006D5316C|nr:hypothetical protein [Paenibacillus sp. A3]KPV60476.1 hypothetical protein QJ48_05245 [Paenibacillus sp. A3]